MGAWVAEEPTESVADCLAGVQLRVAGRIYERDGAAFPDLEGGEQQCTANRFLFLAALARCGFFRSRAGISSKCNEIVVFASFALAIAQP